MPGRVVTALILLFWAAMTAWFALRDAWPRLDPDEPPRLTADLVDEGGETTRGAKLAGVNWAIDRTRPGGATVRYQLETRIEFDARADTFLLTAELQNFGSDIKTTSQYLMDRNGNVSRQAINVQYFERRAPHPNEPWELVRSDTFTFVLRDRHASLAYFTERNPSCAFPVLSCRASASRATEQVFPDVRLPHSGLILCPLQPVFRLERVTPGRTWAVPFFDPLAADPALVLLEGKARRAQEPLRVTRDNRPRTVSCVVFDLAGDGVSGTTWQDADTGEVMRQEWTTRGEKWLIQQSRDVRELRGPPEQGAP